MPGRQGSSSKGPGPACWSRLRNAGEGVAAGTLENGYSREKKIFKINVNRSRRQNGSDFPRMTWL